MEYTWKQFQNLSNIKVLPVNEQIRRYYFYLDELSNQRYNQNKGIKTSELVETSSAFLLQENSDFLLQEDGSRIIWIL